MTSVNRSWMSLSIWFSTLTIHTKTCNRKWKKINTGNPQVSSTNIGAKRNRTIWKIVLICDLKLSLVFHLNFAQKAAIFFNFFTKIVLNREIGVFNIILKPYHTRHHNNQICTIGRFPVSSRESLLFFYASCVKFLWIATSDEKPLRDIRLHIVIIKISFLSSLRPILG